VGDTGIVDEQLDWQRGEFRTQTLNVFGSGKIGN